MGNVHTAIERGNKAILEMIAFIPGELDFPLSLPVCGCTVLAPARCSNGVADCHLWMGSRGKVSVEILRRQVLVVCSPHVCLYRGAAVHAKCSLIVCYLQVGVKLPCG